MYEFASGSAISSELNRSLVEGYTDGVELGGGLVQGIRFEGQAGTPTFRVGARYNERADVEIEITAAAARTLNTLLSADPDYAAALGGFLSTGEMQVLGDPSQLGAWLAEVHDPIVNRTSDWHFRLPRQAHRKTVSRKSKLYPLGPCHEGRRFLPWVSALSSGSKPETIRKAQPTSSSLRKGFQADRLDHTQARRAIPVDYGAAWLRFTRSCVGYGLVQPRPPNIAVR